MPYSIDQFTQELKRGTLTIAVLKMLEKRHYGYSLKKSLMERSFEIEESDRGPKATNVTKL